MFDKGLDAQFNGSQGVYNDAPDFLLKQIIQATDPLNPEDAQRIRQQLEPAKDAITQAIAEAMEDMQTQAQTNAATQQVAPRQILRTFGSPSHPLQQPRTTRQIAQNTQTQQTTRNTTSDTRPTATADTTFLPQTNNEPTDDSPLYPDISLTPEMVEEPVPEPNSQTKQPNNRGTSTNALQNNVPNNAQNNRRGQIGRISQTRRKNIQLQQNTAVLTQQRLLNQLKNLEQLRKQVLQTAKSSQEITNTFKLDTTSILLLVLSVVTSIVNLVDPTEFFAIFLSAPVSCLQLYKRIKTSVELKKYYLKKLPASIALSIWNVTPLLSDIPLKTIHDFYIDQFGRIHKRFEAIQIFRSSRTELKTIDRQIKSIKKQLSETNR
jgi:hypothetical protein